jgi:predicted ferric reductase
MTTKTTDLTLALYRFRRKMMLVTSAMSASGIIISLQKQSYGWAAYNTFFCLFNLLLFWAYSYLIEKHD